ncbi:MAG: hypothetical protein Q8O26_18975 [Phreatobacter sp.]|uniref:hypothetical protein n=1 Tax=Phreatobacter sp. TaxID=1966341 RepID=UPI002736C3A0|nr:hypothetical protein [Phreatobacter sp.]MDP2803961.1 hypothetical protein [Phreatobacter sp.]
MDKQAITFVAIGVFNIGTAVLLRSALSTVDLGQAVLEKDENAAKTTAGSQSNNAANGLATSYSRVTGLIGALVLAAFFWGIGNAVIFNAINDPANVASMLNGVSTFIIGGASLFLPYAANQAREAFAPRNTPPQKAVP